MKLIGKATLVFRDKDTGKITKEITKENNITVWELETRVVAGYAPAFANNIFVSEFSPAGSSSDPNFYNIPKTHPLGFVVTAPIKVDSTAISFAYGELHHRFNAPPIGTTYTINTIGLSSTGPDVYGVISNVQAYVKLAAPCTQADNETLDIFYRLSVPYDYFQELIPENRNTSLISGAQTNELAYRFVIGSQNWFTEVFSNWNGNLDFTKLITTPAYSSSQDSNIPFNTGVLTTTTDLNVHRYEANSAITIDKGIGQLAGYLAFGQGTTNTDNVWCRGVTDIGVDSVIQGTFGHSAAATLPFHDVTSAATGTGTLTINGSGWTNPDFPKMYRLDVTATGGAGVGSYQFRERRHFGFVGNTYKDAFRLMASLEYKNNHMHDGFKFGPQDQTGDIVQDKDVPRWINYITFGEAIAIRKTAICLIKLNTETSVIFNIVNYPIFAPINITQVTVDPTGIIYVGCRDTGIYKIETPWGTPTITKIDNTTPGLDGGGVLSKCYGVHYGNSRLWAMFDGGLFSSIDNGANWVAANFTNPTIVADWSLVKFIKADYTHVDQRLAIVYQSGITSVMQLTMLWWDEALTQTTAGTDGFQFMSYNIGNSYIASQRYFYNEPWTYFMLLEPSPIGNKWGANSGSSLSSIISQPSTLYPGYYVYGTITKITNSATALKNYQCYCSWEIDKLGDAVICVSADETTYQRLFSLYKDDDTFTSSRFRNSNDSLQGNDTSSSSGPDLYLGNMVLLSWFVSSITVFHQILTMNEVGSVEGHPDFQHILYDKYGWNGSAWVKDDPGFKPFHTLAEELNDGITIAFTDVGTTPFLSTDYYTFGVCEGVWLDGSTTIDHATGVSYKKYIESQTGLEAPTLSASVRSPDIFEKVPALTWQDTNGVTATGDGVSIGTAVNFEAGTRSSVALSGKTGLTNHAIKDNIHGSMNFTLSRFNGQVGTNWRCGLSPATVLGTPIDATTIAYCFEIEGTGTGFQNINIWENGVEVAPAAYVVQYADDYTTGKGHFEIEILNNGTVNYYFWDNGTANTVDPVTGFIHNERNLIHTSTGATIEDYHIDIAVEGNVGAGSTYISFSFTTDTIQPQDYPSGYPRATGRFRHRVQDDLYHVFGQFVNSNGLYLPNFFAVDSTQGMTVLIDGVKAMQIADNDRSTVLLAGEISVFPRQGVFRYSGADAGKTVTASYNCLTTE